MRHPAMEGAVLPHPRHHGPVATAPSVCHLPEPPMYPRVRRPLTVAPEGATPRICASAGLTAGILQLQQSIERSPEGDDTPDSK